MRILRYGKAQVAAAIQALGYQVKRLPAKPESHYLERHPQYAGIVNAVQPFTISTYESIAAIVDAVHHVTRNGIPGAIVECGVWRGGAMMAAAFALRERQALRDLYLFDTFAGMTAPTPDDIDYRGTPAAHTYAASVTPDHVDWCYATIDDVRQNMASTGYPLDRCHFVKGDVRETLPSVEPAQIAILHLDTDWYESTRHELTHCFPKLSPGGVLIIDDYGHWQGCQKAVDEYFADSAQFLCALDYSARLTVKAGPRTAGWGAEVDPSRSA